MKAIVFNKNKELDFQANEAFKTLRTNITFCGDDMKVILFTSTLPDEGKSSVVFQLAKSFAEDERKVLLLDADIRKSVLAAHYHVGAEVKGLSHYLAGQEKADNVICHTNIPNMDIIFAGPTAPNPSELLGNCKFDQLIASQRENYQYILIDAPPLGSVIDAAVIAKKSDGAVMVIESGVISRKTLSKVKEQLELSGCRILGVVLNKVDNEYKGYYSRYYGKRGYGYGMGGGGK